MLLALDTAVVIHAERAGVLHLTPIVSRPRSLVRGSRLAARITRSASTADPSCSTAHAVQPTLAWPVGHQRILAVTHATSVMITT
jgi:hypothetical protein